VAKRNKRQRGPLKSESRPPSAMPSSPTTGDKKDIGPNLDITRSQPEKQQEPKDSHTVAIILAVFGTLISVLAVMTGVLWDRWTDEIGDHEKTRGELRHEKGLKETAIAERDQFKKEEADLREKIADLEKRLPNLKFYGPGANMVVNFDLKTDIRNYVTAGRCPQEPCFRITLLNLERQSGGIPYRVVFGFSGVWDRNLLLSPIPVPLPLKKACSRPLEVRGYTITLVIEDTDVTSLRASVVFTRTANDIEGLRTNAPTCQYE